MFSQEVRDLLLQVITSWQVLAVTGAVILYFFLVSYVGNSYRRPRRARVKPPRAPKAAAAAGPAEPVSDDDELGLEEE